MKKQKKPAKLVNFYMTNEDIIFVDENGKEFAFSALCEEFRKQIGGTE